VAKAVAAQLPLRRETGAGCLHPSDHLREGVGIVAPIVRPLVQIEGEDDLDRGRGTGKTASLPPAEERRGVLLQGANALRSSTPRREKEPPPGRGRISIPKGERGSPPLEGHRRKSPRMLPESQPLLGNGGRLTLGLGGPGLERETRAPTPPPAKPEEGVAWR